MLVEVEGRGPKGSISSSKRNWFSYMSRCWYMCAGGGVGGSVMSEGLGETDSVGEFVGVSSMFGGVCGPGLLWH